MDSSSSDLIVLTISTLYSATGLIRVVSYGTQLRALWRDGNGAQSTSIATWVGFLLVWLIGAAYGLVVLDDGPVVFVSLCGAIGSALIVALTVIRRVEHRRRALAL